MELVKHIYYFFYILSRNNELEMNDEIKQN